MKRVRDNSRLPTSLPLPMAPPTDFQTCLHSDAGGFIVNPKSTYLALRGAWAPPSLPTTRSWHGSDKQELSVRAWRH